MPVICMKVQGAVVVSQMLAWASASDFKFLGQRFLCDGQCAVRQAILYADSCCKNITIFFHVASYRIQKTSVNSHYLEHFLLLFSFQLLFPQTSDISS